MRLQNLGGKILSEFLFFVCVGWMKRKTLFTIAIKRPLQEHSDAHTRYNCMIAEKANENQSTFTDVMNFWSIALATEIFTNSIFSEKLFLSLLDFPERFTSG